MRLTRSRMQSIEARTVYKNSFACGAQIFKKEGLTTFWSGAVPRLARLILSGGIVFTMLAISLIAGENSWLTKSGMRKQWKDLIGLIPNDAISRGPQWKKIFNGATIYFQQILKMTFVRIELERNPFRAMKSHRSGTMPNYSPPKVVNTLILQRLKSD